METGLWITALVIVTLLFASAFFSGSETALTAASRGKLHARADKGSKGAGLALRLLDDTESLIGAILLGNNLMNILAASLATVFFTRLFGEGGVAYATLVMTALVVIFAEVLPKTYAITNAETASTRVAPIIAVVIRIFAPIVAFVRYIVRAALGLIGVQVEAGTNILAVREEIEGAITLGHSEGAVEKEHRDRLLGALDLGDRTVEEIMLHRSSIEMIDADWAYWETNLFNGDDRMQGTYHDDLLVGYAGDDELFGGKGDKVDYDVSGNSPNRPTNTINQIGRVEDDPAFYVHDGDDELHGELGDDEIDGGTGHDRLFGGRGNDYLWGGGVSNRTPFDSEDPEAVRDVGADSAAISRCASRVW